MNELEKINIFWGGVFFGFGGPLPYLFVFTNLLVKSLIRLHPEFCCPMPSGSALKDCRGGVDIPIIIITQLS